MRTKSEILLDGEFPPVLYVVREHDGDGGTYLVADEDYDVHAVLGVKRRIAIYRREDVGELTATLTIDLSKKAETK